MDVVNIEAKCKVVHSEGKGKNSSEGKQNFSLTNCAIMQVVVCVPIEYVNFPNVNKATISKIVIKIH